MPEQRPNHAVLLGGSIQATGKLRRRGIERYEQPITAPVTFPEGALALRLLEVAGEALAAATDWCSLEDRRAHCLGLAVAQLRTERRLLSEAVAEADAAWARLEREMMP